MKSDRFSSRQAAMTVTPTLRMLEPERRTCWGDIGLERSNHWAPAAPIRVLPFRPRRQFYRRDALQEDGVGVAGQPSVEISPRESARRHSKRGNGITAEIAQMTRGERFDIRFCGRAHLLVATQGVRAAGETTVEGLPPSSLRDLRRRLSFVPAGRAYHEWQQPADAFQAMFFCFDPERASLEFGAERSDALSTPRLHFEDAALWETALKLTRLIENPGVESFACLEALGVVMMHELIHPALGALHSPQTARGGLARWRQRILTDYIEENLARRISLAELAKLVRLSPYHLCRAFKQSFGAPPHRYHNSRRIERAKILLATHDHSVTEVGLTVGFSETSSFSAAFRKATGLAPTDYRLGLL